MLIAPLSGAAVLSYTITVTQHYDEPELPFAGEAGVQATLGGATPAGIQSRGLHRSWVHGATTIWHEHHSIPFGLVDDSCGQPVAIHVSKSSVGSLPSALLLEPMPVSFNHLCNPGDVEVHVGGAHRIRLQRMDFALPRSSETRDGHRATHYTFTEHSLPVNCSVLLCGRAVTSTEAAVAGDAASPSKLRFEYQPDSAGADSVWLSLKSEDQLIQHAKTAVYWDRYVSFATLARSIFSDGPSSFG